MGVKERYQTKNSVISDKFQKNDSGNYVGVKERRNARLREDAQANITQRLNAFSENSDNFFANYNNRYRNGTELAYRGDSNEWLSRVATQNNNFKREAENIKTYMDQNKSILDEKFVSSVNEFLQKNLAAQEDVISRSEKEQEFFADFESEDDYRKHLSKTYKKKKEDEALLSFDVENAKKQLSAAENRNLSRAEKMDMESLSAYTERAEKAQKLKNYESISDTQSDKYDPNFRKNSVFDPNIKDDVYRSVNDPFYGEEYLDYGRNREETYGMKYGFDHMTDNEKSTYYYLYKTSGKESAKEYLDLISDRLQERKAEQRYQTLEGSTGKELLYSVNAGINQFKEGSRSFVSEFIPSAAEPYSKSSTQLVSEAVREDLSDDGFKLWNGVSLAQAAYDIGTSTSNALPSVVASSVLGGLTGVGAIAQIAGAITLGQSAAGNAYKEMLDLGYSKNQSKVYSLLVGASESGLQYLLGGISKLGGKLTGKGTEAILNSVDKAFARTAIKLGTGFHSEGLEEAIQDLIEPMFKHIATGEATESASLSDAMYSYLIGGISSLIFESRRTIGEASDIKKAGKQIIGNGASQRILAVGKSFDADTVMNRLSNKVNAETDPYTLGRIMKESLAVVNESNQANLSAYLEKNGYSKASADSVAKTYAMLVNDVARLSTEQVNAMKANELITRYYLEKIDPNVGAYERTRALYEAAGITEAKADSGTGNVENSFEKAAKAAESNENKNSATLTTEQIQAISDLESRYGINRNTQGENIITETEVDTNQENVTPENTQTQRTENAENIPIEQTENIGTPEKVIETSPEFKGNEDIELSDEPIVKNIIEAKQYAVKEMKVPESTANELALQYDGKTDPYLFMRAMTEGYHYGLIGVDTNSISRNSLFASLPAEQANFAYLAGADERLTRLNSEKKKISEINKNASGIKQTETRKGVVSSKDISIEKLKNRFNETQSTAYQILTTIAEATGIDIVLFESKPDENGNFTNASGSYSNGSGKIFLDINSGLNTIKDSGDLSKYTMLRTFTHEFTHLISHNAPSEYDVLQGAVLSQIEKNGGNVDELIYSKMSLNDELSYDAASREVVAEALVDILPQSSFLENLYKKDQTLFESIKSKLSEFAKKIKSYFEKITRFRNDDAYALLLDSDKYLESIVQKFDDAALAAIENYNAKKQMNGAKQIQIQAKTDANIDEQMRTMNLSNRELLLIASKELREKNLQSKEYTDALDAFDKKISKLYEIDEKIDALYLKLNEIKSSDKADAYKKEIRSLEKEKRTLNDDLLAFENKKIMQNVLVEARNYVQKSLSKEYNDLIKFEREKSKEALTELKSKQSDKLKTVKQELTEKMLAQKIKERIKLINTKESALLKEQKKRLYDDVNKIKHWISHPDRKNYLNHVPDVLKETIIPFLSSIDFRSTENLTETEINAINSDFINRMEDMREILNRELNADNVYKGYSDLPPEFFGNLDILIGKAKALTAIGNGTLLINNMTSSDVAMLSRLTRNVMAFIRNFNRFHQNAMFQHVYEAGDNSMRFLKSQKEGRYGELSNALYWQQIRPAFAFERFGEGGKSIYQEFIDAQSTFAFNAKHVIDYAKQTYTDEEVSTWEKETLEFQIDGDTVIVPVSYVMSLYLLNKRKASQNHLYGEGIRISAFKKDGKKIEDQGHLVTESIVDEMISKLSDRQKEVADLLQKDMATTGGEWGNHVSVARYGERMFTEPDYFPIDSDGRHLPANADASNQNASLYALLNISPTKEVTKEAKNRVMLYSVFDVYANHMADMAQYNAFSLPILDALRWLNYSEKVNKRNPDGMLIETQEALRDEMSRVYGAPTEKKSGGKARGYAETFLINLIRSYNGTEPQGNKYDVWSIKFLHSYNLSRVAYNARVVIQQPLSIIRAANVIDGKHLLSAFKQSPSTIKANIEEMKWENGIALWKSMGFYDVNISPGLSSMIKHDQSVIDKIGEVGMIGAKKADEITWALMWQACKNQALEKGYANGSTKMKEYVNDLFNEVVYKTQVTDSTMTKSEFMRSKGFIPRTIGSFMSEPVTTASIGLDLMQKFKQESENTNAKNALNIYGSKIARTAAVHCISSILLGCVTAAYDSLRDEDDEKFTEKFRENFIENFIEEISPLSKLPYLSDLVDIFKEIASYFGVDTYGNEPQFAILRWSSDLIKVAKITSGKISGTEKNYTWYGDIYYLLSFVSGITGFPISSATREMITAWNNTIAQIYPEFKISRYLSSDEKKKRLYLAYVDQDESAISAFSKDFKDDDERNAALIKMMRENDTRYREAAVERASGNVDGYTDILFEIENDGIFSRDLIISAINGETSALKKELEKSDENLQSAADALQSGDTTEYDARIKELLSSTGFTKQFIQSVVSSISNSSKVDIPKEIYSASDYLNVLETGGDASRIKDAYIKERVDNGAEQKKVQASLKTAVTEKYKSMYNDAYKNSNKKEMERIRNILYKTGLYGDPSDVMKTVRSWTKEKDATYSKEGK